MKIHQLTQAQIDRAMMTDTPLTALYDMAFPERSANAIILPQYFQVSVTTWGYIYDRMFEHYGREGAQLWLDKGFSSNRDVPNWEVWHDHE